MLNKSNLARYFRSKRVWAFSAAVVMAAVAIPTSSSGYVAAADVAEPTYFLTEDLKSELYLANGAQLTSRENGSDVLLKAGQKVILHYNGEDLAETAGDETVSALLERLGVEPGPLDTVAVDASGDAVEIHVGSHIVLYDRVETVTESPVTYVYNDVLPTWSETVLQQGQGGVHTEVYEVVYSDGREVSRQLVEETDTQATETVIEKGTLSNFAPNDAEVANIVSNGDGTGKIILENGQELTFNQTLNMKATAYTTGDPGVGTITASGTTVRVGTVAVDRKQIPFGTKMYVVSNDGAYLYGFSVAEDTGGAIRQNRIDLYFETYQECINFGVRNCTVYILD